jgi:hypothetical protein
MHKHLTQPLALLSQLLNHKVIRHPHKAQIHLLEPGTPSRQFHQPLLLDIIARMQVHLLQTMPGMGDDGREGRVVRFEDAVQSQVGETGTDP